MNEVKILEIELKLTFLSMKGGSIYIVHTYIDIKVEVHRGHKKTNIN